MACSLQAANYCACSDIIKANKTDLITRFVTYLISGTCPLVGKSLEVKVGIDELDDQLAQIHAENTEYNTT